MAVLMSSGQFIIPGCMTKLKLLYREVKTKGRVCGVWVVTLTRYITLMGPSSYYTVKLRTMEKLVTGKTKASGWSRGFWMTCARVC